MEQEEYTKEEINWSYVEFVDNQDVLDLIEKVTYNTQLYIQLTKIIYIYIYKSCHLMVCSCMQKPGGIIALLDEAWYVSFPICKSISNLLL